MLITSVFVNERSIDDLFIHNTGCIDVDKDIWEYEVLDHVTGKKLIKEIIIHKRKDGYRSLLIQALTLLEKHKIKTQPIDRDKAEWLHFALSDNQ